MLERLTINLSVNEKRALETIAIAEMRNLREQVRFILRREFERRGLLQTDPALFVGDDPKQAEGGSDVAR